MQEKEETWLPHLLGFILPIVTISGIYMGGWWCFSGFVYALGLCPIIDYFAPEVSPTRAEVSKGPWNSLLFAHGLFFYVSIGILLWRANLDGFTVPVILGGLSVGIVGGISGIINAHESGTERKAHGSGELPDPTFFWFCIHTSQPSTITDTTAIMQQN